MVRNDCVSATSYQPKPSCYAETKSLGRKYSLCAAGAKAGYLAKLDTVERWDFARRVGDGVYLNNRQFHLTSVIPFSLVPPLPLPHF